MTLNQSFFGYMLYRTREPAHKLTGKLAKERLLFLGCGSRHSLNIDRPFGTDEYVFLFYVSFVKSTKIFK